MPDHTGSIGASQRLCCFNAVLALWLSLLWVGAAWGQDSHSKPSLRFERDVWPIIAANCIACHGAEVPKAGLDLRTAADILKGGESGPVVDKSEPDSSLLLERVTRREMPPGKARKLSAQEVSLLRDWIRAGARADHPDRVPPQPSIIREEDRQFWSFSPLARSPIPRARDNDLLRTPIDAFLLSRLEAKGLSFSPDAETPTLIRRAYLDLHGLPPSPEDVDAFSRDLNPGAFERLIDRLLASPHFGERWGRHWLDVAGYVDTVGFDTDATNIITSEGKWLYRDYVIRAFNNDKPYDRFITEQLAGDELHDWRRAERFTPEIREGLIATGYLRTARDLTHEDVGIIPQNFFGIMHDTIEIVGTGLLGLTINCARCHSHKFDPIPQDDYYRLMAIFTPAYNPRAWLPVVPSETKSRDRGLPDVSPAELAKIEAFNSDIDRQIGNLRNQLDDAHRPCTDRLRESKLSRLPQAIRTDVKSALTTPAEKRDEVQKYLAGKFEASLTVKPEEVKASLNSSEKTTVAQLEAKIAATGAKRRKWGKIQALYDLGVPPATHLLLRGNEQSPGHEVPPGFLRVLSRTDAESLANSRAPFADTTGRRSDFARWLTRKESPASALLARVMVNRIWKQLFGRGIVATPDNFGIQGQRPTHPELLEWLSSEFISNGWRVKPMIKLMMTSTAYLQASRGDSSAGSLTELAERVDPANDLLWRMRMRRLEAEAVRDAILAASGDLDPTVGGPPVLIKAQADGMVTVARERLEDQAAQYRRSVYLLTRRAYNLSLLTVFDQPVVATNCLQRSASALPLQSLFMINDSFLIEQAEHLSRRVERNLHATSSQQEPFERAFRTVLTRAPSSTEMEICTELLRRQTERARSSGTPSGAAEHQALAQLCLTLLNTSEFLLAE
jgi:hypothetical protein